jgi:hypothetical protein
MYPRSGGEKVYLEAVKPSIADRSISRLIFATSTILINLSSGNYTESCMFLCIISDMHCASGFRRKVWLDSHPHLICAISQISISIAAGHHTGIGVVRDSNQRFMTRLFSGDPVLMTLPPISFVVFLHGFTPRLGIYAMDARNVFIPSLMKCSRLYQVLTLFKVATLVFVVVIGKPTTFLRVMDLT